MKKYLVLFLITIVGFTSCEEDLIIYDTQNGQTALSFGATSYNESIPLEGLTIDVPVQSTTSSGAARTFNATVTSSTGSASEYTVGAVTIPAGEFVGTMPVTFAFDDIEGPDGLTKDLVITLEAPSGGVVYDEVVNITYFREIVCNDLQLEINTDFWASETSYEITDSTGAVVASGGPWPNGVATYNFTITLPDGCYTFTMFDAYGDGMQDGTNVGSYSLTCSIIQHASGGDNFGASDSTDFCVNP